VKRTGRAGSGCGYLGLAVAELFATARMALKEAARHPPGSGHWRPTVGQAAHATVQLLVKTGSRSSHQALLRPGMGRRNTGCSRWSGSRGSPSVRPIC
jgi:hypothetical protein